MRQLALLALLALAAACSETVAPPVTRVFTFASINGGATAPLVHFCTPAYPSTLQWVAGGDATLTVQPDGTFQLDEFEETGIARYHMNGTTRIYDLQGAEGGHYQMFGTAVDATDGSSTLRFERAGTSGDATAFAGRLFRDSAVVMHRMVCRNPTAPDSSVWFNIVLR